MVLFKSRSTAAVYAQVDRRLTVTVKVEVCHWRSAVLGNNKNNKTPFSLPRAGTTTLPSLKIKPSSQVTKWGARSERVNQKNKRTRTPSPSLSLNRHTAGTQPPSFFRFFLVGTQPHTVFSPCRHTAISPFWHTAAHSFLSLSAHSLAMHSFLLVGYSQPFGAQQPQLLFQGLSSFA